MLALHPWNRKPNTFLWTGYFSKSCYKAWCRRAKPSPLPRKNGTLAAEVMTSGGGGEKAGYAIVTSHKHQSLTLTGRLPKRLKESPWAEHRDRNETNIYTDSECAFTVGATHIAIWKARWWLTGRWSSLKHHKEILQWLAAFNLSEKVTVLHWRGHQMHHSSTSERNQKENREAKAMVPTPHPTSLSLLLFNKTLEPLCLWTPNVMCMLRCICGSMQILTCVRTHGGLSRTSGVFFSCSSPYCLDGPSLKQQVTVWSRLATQQTLRQDPPVSMPRCGGYRHT